MGLRIQRTVKMNGQPNGKSVWSTLEQHQRLMEKHANAARVEAYNRWIGRLTGLHRQAAEFVDWHQLHAREEPFPPHGTGPREAQALAALEHYRPGLLARIWRPLRERAVRKLEQAVETARRQDAEQYEQWRSRHELSGRILQGDPDAYLEAIDVMRPLADLLEFVEEIEFGASRPSEIEAELRVKPAGFIPNYALSLTKTGKLSHKELSKTAYFALVQDYVCSCAIRIAREMFALLPVRSVVVHAVDRMVNLQTGHGEDAVILSVLFERDKMTGLNFERIDPSEAIKRFTHEMNFARTGGFQPVERVAAG